MAQPVQADWIRLFAEARSEPFSADIEGADIEGALHGFKWTGHDDFAGNNVLSIALEVPDDMLGAGPVTGIWASISRRRDGTLEQMDRGGKPTINPFINPDGEKDLYNSRQPADDVANYLQPWSKILETAATRPRRPGRQPSWCCPTSSVTTAPSLPATPTVSGRRAHSPARYRPIHLLCSKRPDY